MKYLIISCILVISVISCQKKIVENKNVKKSVDSASEVSENVILEENSTDNCYASISDKDSLYLSLNDNLGTITGKLRIKSSVENSSFGDVVGNKNGDTIILNYKYQSNGSDGEKEIYFLKKGENIIEGIGKQKMDGETSVYENHKKITYPDENALKPTDCKQMQKEFVIETPKK